MDSEETENIKTEDKVGLEVVKVKEDLEVMEADKEMEVVVDMEMVKSQESKSTHLIKME